MKTIYIATNNHHKVVEVTALAKPFDIEIHEFKCDIRELQTLDRRQLIRNKTVEAFTKARMPVLVDHASLEIDCLNGMPGTLTQIFWDKLEGKICEIVNAFGTRNARAISTVAYCDGKEIYDDEAIVNGTISEIPFHISDFQWDTIFIPEGDNRTYAEIRESDSTAIDKHRKLAFEKLFDKIKKM